MTTSHVAPPPARPLIITGDPELLDDVLRLAAAAGVDVDVAAHALASPRAWHRAPLVIVGDDQLDRLVASAPRRRGGVLIAHRTSVGVEPEARVWRQAVALGAEHVVTLPQGEAWLVERFADSGDAGRPDAVVLAFLGARGGAGASTLASAVGLRSARSGLSTVLIDCDPWGGGLDLALGIEGVPGLRWPELAHTAGRVAAGALSDVLPRCEDLSVLSWGSGAEVEVPRAAVTSLLDAAIRGFALVIADLARGHAEASDEVLRRASTVCLVVPREIRAVAAAHRSLSAIEPHGARMVMVTRGPSPSGLDPGAVADSLGIDVIADLRSDSRIAAAFERGELPVDRGSLARVAAAVLADVSGERGAAA